MPYWKLSFNSMAHSLFLFLKHGKRFEVPAGAAVRCAGRPDAAVLRRSGLSRSAGAGGDEVPAQGAVQLQHTLRR